MRWPLRYQILLPMAAIMLLAVLVVGGLGAVLAARAIKARIESQIADVTQILEQSNFPLTDAVLRQMKSLSGAEMMLVGDGGHVLASSGASGQFAPLLDAAPASERQRIPLGDRLWVHNQGFFHTDLPLAGRGGSEEATTLHIFYPEVEYRRAWQHAVYPSIGFVVVALPIVMLLAAMTAARISSRVTRLQGQVDRIAHGDFHQLALADRNDEIRALGQSVNRMAAMLARYEDEVRRTERMRTLALLGGGIAHQLRNSATGCSMALDLHAAECSIGSSETLDVARRQLQLMEEYLQRFLQLGKPADSRVVTSVNMATLVDKLLPLVQPAARHAHVDLRWQRPEFACTVLGSEDQLGQLLVNLLLNAIEAAAQSFTQSNTASRVEVELSRPEPDQLLLTVSDSGRGPAEQVSDEIFEPFVTEKPDGVGLGLAVAREIVEQHGGQITWRHADGTTHFMVELPCEHLEMQCV